jgi:hypothetical protein
LTLAGILVVLVVWENQVSDMATIEDLKSEKRLKSLDEFDQGPIYTMPDKRRSVHALLVAGLGLMVGVALGFLLVTN